MIWKIRVIGYSHLELDTFFKELNNGLIWHAPWASEQYVFNKIILYMNLKNIF